MTCEWMMETLAMMNREVDTDLRRRDSQFGQPAVQQALGAASFHLQQAKVQFQRFESAVSFYRETKEVDQV